MCAAASRFPSSTVHTSFGSVGDNDLFRSTLLEKLTEIHARIAQSDCSDEVSKKIVMWHADFTASLESEGCSLESVVPHFFAELQNILRDTTPFQYPLDEETYIGNDGHVYGERILALLCEAKGTTSSPCNPDFSERLIVRPHALARHLVSFAQTHDFLIEDEDLNSAYARIFSTKQPSIPIEKKGIIHESALRRKFLSELRAVRDLLRTDPFEGSEFSSIIQGLYMLMHESLKSGADAGYLYSSFIESLAQLMRSADEYTYMGSDGQMYGRKELTCLLAKEAFGAGFTVKVYPLARHLAKHLQKEGHTLPIDCAIEAEFQAIETFPEIPLEGQSSIRARLRALRKTREKAAHAASSNVQEKAQQEFSAIRSEIEAAKARVVAQAEEASADEAAMRQQLQDEIHRLKERLAGVREELEEVARRAGDVEDAQKVLQEEIAKLDEAIKEEEGKRKNEPWELALTIAAVVAFEIATPPGVHVYPYLA